MDVSVCKREGKIGDLEAVDDGGEELFSGSMTSSDDSGISDLSSASDFMKDGTSSSSPSSSPSAISSSNSSVQMIAEGLLFQMSSPASQSPFKRGLSKHFQGKSQSFSSLAEVNCLADLAKPEKPYKKRLKPSRSYAANLDGHHHMRSYPPTRASIAKKDSPKTTSSARNGFVGNNKPPIPTYNKPL